jgi:hypothetical protein
MRKMSRKVKRGRKGSRRRMRGGAQTVVPASLGDTSMQGPGRMNLGQGSDYLRLHQGQYGGAAVSLASAAPMGHTGVLDSSLRDYARIGPLDQSLDAIRGMQDGGGKKGRMNHKLIIAMLKKLSKKLSRKKQRGGMPYALTQAQDYSTPGMLLSPSAERAALGYMNPEWKLAADPTSFAPKM